MKKYRHIQLIATLYLAIYLAALYFSTGVHTGFKLDDNQLSGYVLCALLLVSLLGSLFASSTRQRKWLVGLLVIIPFAMLGVIVFHVVDNNEAFVYFMFFVYLIPFWELIEALDFFWHAH